MSSTPAMPLTRVTIGAPNKYSDTTMECSNPSVAISATNKIAEIHVQKNTGDDSGKVYYSLGEVTGPTYGFSDPIQIGPGASPSIGLVETDKGLFAIITFLGVIPGNDNGYIYVKAGYVNKDTNSINFTYNKFLMLNNVYYAYALNASAAINSNGLVVIAYESYENRIQYNTGLINFDTGAISFNQNYTNPSSGKFPKISLSSDNAFIEVHKSETMDSLYYNYGSLGLTSSNQPFVNFIIKNQEYIGVSNWKASVSPAIALNASGYVVEVHSSAADESLYFSQGYTTTTNIELFSSENYLNYDFDNKNLEGYSPSVAINDDGIVIQVFQAANNGLYGSISKFSNRSNWMKDYQSFPLNQLCIPGSHDAAMYTNNNCSSLGDEANTITQIQKIADQLVDGIRYFDLRPVFEDDGSIYCGHFAYDDRVGYQGCDGEKMADILQGVNDFITQSDNKTEVVVLKFSHFFERKGDHDRFFNDPKESETQKQELIDDLINLINNKIPDNKFVRPGGKRIAEMSLTEITGGSGKVILLFDIQDLANVTFDHNTYGKYLDLISNMSTADINNVDFVIYDNYSNTDDMDVMTCSTNSNSGAGQFYKLKQAANHKGDLFLLSWTLTLQTGELENPLDYTILEICQKANRALAKDIFNNTYNSITNTTGVINKTNFPNIIFVDAANGPATDVCIWLNQQGFF